MVFAKGDVDDCERESENSANFTFQKTSNVMTV